MGLLDLNDLRVFVQVVEHGGFTNAARALNRPKSSLSSRVARLEEFLEARLIQRTSRRFTVTDVGRELYQHACAMLAEAAAAEESVRRRTSEPRGAVRLTCSPATAQAGLASVLADFATAFPEVRVHLAVSNRRVDLVEEGYDIAVRAHQDPLPDSGLVQRRLGFSPRWLTAAPAYLLQSGEPREPAELERLDGLAGGRGADGPWTLTSIDGDARDVQPKIRFCANDALTLRLVAVQGLGIAPLPAGLCRADFDAGRLRRVLPGWICGGAAITLLAPSRRGQLPSVRALIEFIAGALPAEMGLT